MMTWEQRVDMITTQLRNEIKRQKSVLDWVESWVSNPVGA